MCRVGLQRCKVEYWNLDEKLGKGRCSIMCTGSNGIDGKIGKHHDTLSWVVMIKSFKVLSKKITLKLALKFPDSYLGSDQSTNCVHQEN